MMAAILHCFTIQINATVIMVVATMVQLTPLSVAGPASSGCRENHTSSSSHHLSMWNWREAITTAGAPVGGAKGHGASPLTMTLAGNTAMYLNVVSIEERLYDFMLQY